MNKCKWILKLSISLFLPEIIYKIVIHMIGAITRFWDHAHIIGHFDKNASTYLIWKNRRGEIFHEAILTLAKKGNFWKQLSKRDAFLFGYLLGAEQEKL